MENLRKKIIVALLTLVSFLTSFILYDNDLTNYLIISITITIILFVCLCIIVFKRKPKNEYDKNLSKILKSYDSILVYSDVNYEIEEESITFAKNISDLVRYCDETNKTIIYIEEEEASSFIVKTEEGLLVYIMKKYDYSRSEIEQKIHVYLKDLGDKNE